MEEAIRKQYIWHRPTVVQHEMTEREARGKRMDRLWYYLGVRAIIKLPAAYPVGTQFGKCNIHTYRTEFSQPMRICWTRQRVPNYALACPLKLEGRVICCCCMKSKTWCIENILSCRNQQWYFCTHSAVRCRKLKMLPRPFTDKKSAGKRTTGGFVVRFLLMSCSQILHYVAQK
jgi:hypothetical protein